MQLFFREDLGMVIVFLGNHLFECELFFSLVGFNSEFRKVCMIHETPDLVGGVFNQGGPEEMTELFSVCRKLAKSWKLIQITQDFHFAKLLVDEGVNFFQPRESEDEILEFKICNKHID